MKHSNSDKRQSDFGNSSRNIDLSKRDYHPPLDVTIGHCGFEILNIHQLICSTTNQHSVF